MSAIDLAEAEANVARLLEALRPFAALVPSSLHPSDGSEAEGYSALLFESDRLGHQTAPDFTGADLARARLAVAKALGGAS